jgi:hypothetical protein
MPGIRANITIDLKDGEDFQEHIRRIETQISRVSGLKTSVSIKDVDDPISLFPSISKKINRD